MTGKPQPRQIPLSQSDAQIKIMSELRSFGLTDKEIGLAAGVKPPLVGNWHIAKFMAASNHLERLILARDLATDTVDLLGQLYETGHISVLFTTPLASLGGSAPGDYIARHGETGRRAIMNLPRFFAREVASGRVAVSGQQARYSRQAANRKSRTVVEAEEAGDFVDALLHVDFSCRDINLEVLKAQSDVAGALHIRSVQSVDKHVYFQLKQMALAAEALLLMHFRPSEVAQQLRRRNAVAGMSILDAVATCKPTDLSRKLTANRIRYALDNLPARRLRA